MKYYQTQKTYFISVSLFNYVRNSSLHFPRGISGGWIGCWGENKKEIFGAISHHSCPLSVVFYSEWKFWFLLWAGLRGREQGSSIISSFFLPKIFLFSTPRKEQMKPWLCFLDLPVNPNQGFLILIFPYATEANCLELFYPSFGEHSSQSFFLNFVWKWSKVPSHPIAPKMSDFLCEKYLLFSGLGQLTCFPSAEMCCTGSFFLLCLISHSKGIIKEEE